MASESNDAPMPANTPAEIKTALAFLTAAAKAADELGNDLLHAKRHRQINDLLVLLETLHLEASLSDDFDRLLVKSESPAPPPFAVGP